MDGIITRGRNLDPASDRDSSRLVPRLHAPAPVPAAPSTNPAAMKGPSDYLRALYRRVWLILAVAVPMAIATSIWALRQPRIYQAVAEVTIEPPRFNPMLSALVSRDLGGNDPHVQETYIPNLIALLRSRTLADRVVSDASLANEVSKFDDPAQELIIGGLQVRPFQHTNMILVTLEGKDPTRTKKLLEALLLEFKNLAEKDNVIKVEDTQVNANSRLDKLKKNLDQLDKEIMTHLSKKPTVGPGGKNIFEEQYVNLGNTLAHKQMRIGELTQQLLIAKSFPKPDFNSVAGSREQRIAHLEMQKNKFKIIHQ
jgi:succinoglycan biosynthesis transport protein ExoP